MIEGISDPKQRQGAPRRWYRYYAGYSPDFVNDVLAAMGANEGTLLDPWMGAGTSLAVGASHGLNVIGMDLNPAMVVVSKGRLTARDTLSSIEPLARELVHGGPVPTQSDAEDPLTQWFEKSSTAEIRSLVRRIDHLLTDHEGSPPDQRVDRMSSLAALFYVALFAITKRATREFQSRNPTWTKTGRLGSGTATISNLSDVFLSEVRHLINQLETAALPKYQRDAVQVKRGDTRSLAGIDNEVDYVITSPPYATRIDYLVGHGPELACLGYGAAEIKSLRRQMIGTPTIGHTLGVDIGEYAATFIEAVEAHESYASKGYYAKTFRQYFEGMAESLTAIDRAVRIGGRIVLVVQDSRYKDLYLDLALAMTSIGARLNWQLVETKSFTAVRSIQSLNRRTSPENRSAKPIESVVLFEKVA